MENKLAQWLGKADDIPQLFFRAYAAVLLLCLFTGIATEWYFLAGIPALLLLVFLTVVNLRAVFFLLLVCIPLSTEFYLPNGFGTDLPTEPLMIGLLLAGTAYAIRHGREIDGRFLRHPITLVLLAHLAWILVTALTSQLAFVSIKFLLAKAWYVGTFFFLASRMLVTEKDIRLFTWCLFLPLMGTVFYVIIRHASYDFSFADVYRVLHPFYRNHVAYAAIIVLLLPYVWFVRQWYRPYSLQWWLLAGSLPVLLLAVQLSYTRAAYVAVVIAIGAYFVIKLRLTKYVLMLALIGTMGFVLLMAHQNRYLDYAPNYETTVSHKDFNNLIQATYELEDISTMERLYRWVSGAHMSIARPLLGFGPGNFYNFYKSYTVTSFQTYVSHNPDKSGIHSYYLMTLVEQGGPGLLLFLLLCAFSLLKGEAIYHQAEGRKARQMAMMALLSLIILFSLLIINDLIETDKAGPFFFMALALLINLDLRQKKRISDG